MTKQVFKNNEVVIETPVYKLNRFNVGVGMPVLVIPPHAGRHGNIAQRLINKLVSENRTVYAYELLSANQKTKNTSIDDLVNAVSDCQKYIGETVDLIGLCQGGWLSALYTALNQDKVNRLFCFATPINTKTGQKNAIEKYMNSNPFLMMYHEWLVCMNNGIQTGALQWLSFAMANPNYVFVERWQKLQGLIYSNDQDGIAKWRKNNDWYDTPQDLAGVWFLQALKHLFYNNDLYEGRWVVCGKYVNLNKITCECFLYAGDDDDITHPQQMFDMAKRVGTKNVKCTLFKNAGHTKVFVGTDELNQFIEDFLE